MSRTIDDQGCEIRKRRCGAIRCVCSRVVKLYQETDVWRECRDVKRAPLKWLHDEYGDPHGFCECGYAYHGMPDGQMVRIDCREKKGV